MEPTLEVKQYLFLKNRVKLDLLDLENELMDMPELIRIGGEVTAEAISRVNTAKAAYKETCAWVSGELRKLPAASGKYRSESQIDTELYGTKEVVDAVKLLNEAQKDQGLWEALMASLMNKSYTISSSVELIKAGYITQDSLIEKRREELRR